MHCLTIILFLLCVGARPVSISPERLSGRITAQNGFTWRYGYDIEVKDNRVLVHVAINLIPVYGVSKPELDRAKHEWERGIERIWSQKFLLITGEGERYPVVIDVSFNGIRFHHEVIVRPGYGNSDELNWNIKDRPEIAAHEFGHMVGLFDEYLKGATAPQNTVQDNSGIMTGNPSAEAKTYMRHYEGFRTWFIKRTGLKDVFLQSILYIL